MTGPHPAGRLRLVGLGIAFGAGLLTGHLAGRQQTADLRARLAHAERRAEQAQQRADHDALTGLLNRDGARRRLEHQPTAGLVVLIDLDGFKQINDQHGHPAGDALLTQIGRRLGEDADRTGGLAARLGGDEFLLVLPLAPDSAVEVVESILDTLTGRVTLPLPDGPVTVYPGLSAGLAARTGHHPTGPTWTEALHRADIALYHAKRDPRRRLVSHVPGMRHPRLRDLPPDATMARPALP